MLAIFGWLVIFSCSLGITGTYLAIGVFCMGTYGLGGGVNSVKEKAAWVICGIGLVGWWYWVFDISPLAISIVKATQQ